MRPTHQQQQTAEAAAAAGVLEPLVTALKLLHCMHRGWQLQEGKAELLVVRQVSRVSTWWHVLLLLHWQLQLLTRQAQQLVQM
jgi:hypothetical protein